MSYKNIGSRLTMAASLIENGKIVCDVGCDHGKLSLYLIKENKAEHIIATDINKMPLERAIQLFQKENLQDKASFFLTDGLSDVKATDNITHVVIAGLGGETMANIINEADFIKKNLVKLVLLPAQSGYRIRQYLFENGFSILSENIVEENGRFYSAILAEYSAVIISPTVFDCYIGKSFSCNGNSAIGYFDMVRSQLNKKKSGQIITKGSCDYEMEDAIKKIQIIINNLSIS